MKKLILAFFVFVLLFVSCAKQSVDNSSQYIENYITQLKDIEKMTTEKFDKIMLLFESVNENQNDSLVFEIRDAILESTAANKQAVEEFRSLATKQKPDFVDDTIQIMLTTATALLAQSYEIRSEAQIWLNRYISLGTPRFFNEYLQLMEKAMQASKQAFFFLTTARVRQKVIMGDTLDMTISEFLNIPELPQDTSQVDTSDEAAVAEEVAE